MINVPDRDTRRYTTALLNAIDDGVISAQSLVADLLEWMSDDDIQRFGDQYDLWEETE